MAAVIGVVGIVEAPFRIANGFLADRKITSVYNQFAAELFLAGACTFISAVVPGLPGE